MTGRVTVWCLFTTSAPSPRRVREALTVRRPGADLATEDPDDSAAVALPQAS